MISLRTKAGGPRGRHSRLLAVAICLASAAFSAYGTWKSHPTAQEIARAEDEVYEAVVRDMLPKTSNETRGIQLVFQDRLTVGDFPSDDLGSCQGASTKWVQVADEPPPFDTATDGMHRLPTSGVYRTTPGPEVMESYLRVRCVGGRISRSFHTDYPKSFIGNDDLRSGDPLGPIAGDSEFARIFPGATGIIGLSHAGFNKRLDE